jgi:hypothetical protein
LTSCNRTLNCGFRDARHNKRAGGVRIVMSASLVFGSPLDGLLERLYARSLAQDDMVLA